MAREQHPLDDQPSDDRSDEDAHSDPAPDAGEIRRPDDEAPGNFVDDPDADEVPEPNEPA